MLITRRHALALGASLAFRPLAKATASSTEVNDVHSQLNATQMDRIVRPRSVDDLHAAVASAKECGLPIIASGSRHSMGGQQFCRDGVLLDMRGMNRVLGLNPDTRTVDVEPGIQWPELIAYLAEYQQDSPLGIIQKQTGADWLTLGGALASNVHGRGLAMKPIIENVESFEILTADGSLRRCSRTENSELFRLAIGGYGMFGVFTRISLRLRPRVKVQRIVELRHLADIPSAFEDRIKDGYLYGDFQFATDGNRDSFLHRGVFSCYRPVPDSTSLTPNPTRFRPEDWARLTYYSHKYKRRAFDVYTKRYVATSGQIYWADSQISGAYVPNYHEELDRKLGATTKGSEMITEIYVPRANLIEFMDQAAVELRSRKANVIYGTVRLIEKDDQSFLAWAKDRYACIIFNLHIDHQPQKIDDAAAAFRALIDLGISHGGSYYLTYHRFATASQLRTCYPQMSEFLQRKKNYDSAGVFQSEWYRNMVSLTA